MYICSVFESFQKRTTCIARNHFDVSYSKSPGKLERRRKFIERT